MGQTSGVPLLDGQCRQASLLLTTLWHACHLLLPLQCTHPLACPFVQSRSKGGNRFQAQVVKRCGSREARQVRDRVGVCSACGDTYTPGRTALCPLRALGPRSPWKAATHAATFPPPTAAWIWLNPIALMICNARAGGRRRGVMQMGPSD